MINRSLITLGLLSAAILPLAAPPAVQAQGRKPRVLSTSVTPARVAGSGGLVTVRVRISPNGATVTAVRATAQIQGANGPSVTLAPAGTNVYSGQLRFPANTKTNRLKANIFVEVQSSTGTLSRRAGAVVIDAGTGGGGGTPPGDGPPAPPADF